MSEFNARVRRVRMKSGGADVTVINSVNHDNGDGEDWRGSIVANARRAASFASAESPLVGYVVVGLFADGQSSVGWRYDAARCVVPRTLLPHWVSEVIRRDIVTGTEAADTFERMFEWVE